MIARKTQKIIYNILIPCFLIGGATYVCSRFIHLGNIEYTDNAQVETTYHTDQYPCTGIHQENLL